MGPPAYPIRWDAWRDIGVGYGLALVPLVTAPLPSLQKDGLMGVQHHYLQAQDPPITYSIWDFLSVTDVRPLVSPNFFFSFFGFWVFFFRIRPTHRGSTLWVRSHLVPSQSNKRGNSQIFFQKKKKERRAKAIKIFCKVIFFLYIKMYVAHPLMFIKYVI